jgi:hypothetical protein
MAEDSGTFKTNPSNSGPDSSIFVIVRGPPLPASLTAPEIFSGRPTGTRFADF